ncbi:hypothetical protein V494_06850 [Pseudogymnoascus sp. VKM F-4513 (FW-928)]|nr:hypothetical protein V494_06850 [Pseudogymnoascus sp. VKM F-4513 (FW-928)]
MRPAGRPTGVGMSQSNPCVYRLILGRSGRGQGREGTSEKGRSKGGQGREGTAKKGRNEGRNEGRSKGERAENGMNEGTKERRRGEAGEVINEGTIGNNDGEGEARGSETDKIGARVGAFIWNETAGKVRKGAWKRTTETGRFEEAERRDGFVDLSRTVGSASATSYPPLCRGDVGLFHTP